MTTEAYLTGRRRYGLPQAMLWADNPGTLVDGYYYPDGSEIGADFTGLPESQRNNFLILSDHNRGELEFRNERIQQRQRMINGTMRSYNIADKVTLSTSWAMLPSKAYSNNPAFDLLTGQTEFARTESEFTVDGGAGGLEILNWYEIHQGPFWVYLAYDRYDLNTKYNQIIKMYFADFNYSIVKRGRSTHDFWNISLTLEEV